LFLLQRSISAPRGGTDGGLHGKRSPEAFSQGEGETDFSGKKDRASGCRRKPRRRFYQRGERKKKRERPLNHVMGEKKTRSRREENASGYIRFVIPDEKKKKPEMISHANRPAGHQKEKVRFPHEREKNRNVAAEQETSPARHNPQGNHKGREISSITNRERKATLSSQTQSAGVNFWGREDPKRTFSHQNNSDKQKG